MIETAAQLSKQWHEGQVDKAGKPYWTHPARVARNVQTSPGFLGLNEKDQEIAICVAYLHDVMEDCGVSAPDLIKEGFSMATVHPVWLLSKNHGSKTIEDYCFRVRTNRIARIVKLADLSDNCNKKREADLRALGVTIDETKYPKVLRMLHPSPKEQAWFDESITDSA